MQILKAQDVSESQSGPEGSHAFEAMQKTEVYEKKDIKQKDPVPYIPVREADVIWEKTIWRMIDLRQTLNMPLYYPTDPIGDRMSITDLLLYGIKNEGLNAYDPEDPEAINEFDIRMTPEQVEKALGAKTDTQSVQTASGTLEDKIIEQGPQKYQVKKLLVKEKWYFDKNYSRMFVRIVGLCPVRLYHKEDNPEMYVMKRTFWVYYPEARPILANHPVFNRNNDAQRITFDDYFMQRRFDGTIFAESNVYNNRQINEYKSGIETLWEAERIEHNIFIMEHDMWVF
jgi:gliding motility associated protien GldN